MRRKFVLIALIAVVFSALAILVGCSGAKSLFGPTQLATPDNISYDGSNITWSSVENATKYSVSINDGAALSVRSAVYTYNNTTNTQFTVSIIAKADDTESYEDSETATHTFIPVDSVTDVTVAEDGSISWTAVSNVSGYYVSVDGETQVVYTNSFSGLEAGTHTVMVKPYVEVESTAETVDYTYYSVWSSSETITICEDVDADTIKYSTLTGQISWGSVAGATGYEVTITSDYETKTEIVNTSSYTYDAQKGNFSVSVKAVGSHTASYDSVNTTTKKFAYLETATNLRVEDGILYWNEVEGATGYYIKINGTTQGSTVEATQYSGFSANMSYTINIMPTCDDTVYFSAWTADYSFKILPAPEVTWNNIGLDGNSAATVTWDGVDGAVGYVVLVTFPDGSSNTYTYGAEQRSYSYDYSETGTYTVSVKSAGSETSDAKDSVYSSAINVVRLAAPSFVDNDYITSNANNLSDGYTITYQAVSLANGYQIYLNGNEWAKTTKTQYTGSSSDLTTAGALEGGTFTIKIQSIGQDYNTTTRSVILSSLSSKSLSCTITVLSTPVLDDVAINDYTYSYSTISGSFGYCVSVDGVANVSTNASYDLSDLSTGSHVVKVCARGNGGNVLASNYTAETTVVRLVAPTDVYVRTEESEGTLNFSAVQHAKSYLGVIDASKQSFPVDSSTDITGYITTTGTTMYFQTVANYYDGGIYYMTSPSGSTYTFVKLTAPDTLTFTGSQFVWNSPTNSGSFTPTYVVYNGQGVTQRSTTTTSIDTSWLEGGTAYTLTVKAVGSQKFYNGVQYINSDLSAGQQAFKLASPTIKIQNNQYTWYSVDSAVSYTVYVGDDLVYTPYNVAGTTFTYTPSFDEIKTYEVRFYAIGGVGEGITYIDSEATLIEQVTKQLSTPEFDLSYSESYVSTTGEIVTTITTESPYATGYYYSYGGATAKEGGTTYSLNPNTTSGAIEVRVYAAGGGFDDEGICYINSQSTSKTIVLLGNPTESTISVNDYGAITWGSVTNASGYSITLEFATSSGSYTATIENLKSASFSWSTYIFYADDSESYSGISFSDVTYLKVTISATSASALYFVPSAGVSHVWNNL